MKKLLCSFIILAAVLYSIAAQDIDSSKLVFYQKNDVSRYQFIQNGIPLTNERAAEVFSDCPYNEKIIPLYKVSQKTGEVLSTSGMSLVAGMSVFYFVTTLSGRAEDFKDIQLYGALTGGIMFVSGVLSLQTGLMRLKTAQKNYNLYIMGIPAAQIW